MIAELSAIPPQAMVIEKLEKKKEKKNPPLLFNLAELQNECSRLFKLSPDETLKVVQELYEKKLVTYPRTDARVLQRPWQRKFIKISAAFEILHPYLILPKRFWRWEAIKISQRPAMLMINR